MNHTDARISPVRTVLLGLAEAILATALVVALIFVLARLAEARANRPIAAGADGLVVFRASQASLQGGLQLEPRVLEEQRGNFDYEFGNRLAEERDSRRVDHWTAVGDSVAWRFSTPVAGSFDVVLEYAADAKEAGGQFELTVGDQRLTGTVAATGGEAQWKALPGGRVTLAKPGVYELIVKSTKLASGRLMQLKSVTLKRLS